MGDGHITLTFHTDPGHGWLEVSGKMVRELRPCFDSEISGCSFWDSVNDNFFLEEDCDAPLVMFELRSRGFEIHIADVHYDEGFDRVFPRLIYTSAACAREAMERLPFTNVPAASCGVRAV